MWPLDFQLGLQRIFPWILHISKINSWQILPILSKKRHTAFPAVKEFLQSVNTWRSYRAIIISDLDLKRSFNSFYSVAYETGLYVTAKWLESCKVKETWICIALRRAAPLKRSDMAVCNKGITQFYLPPTHKPYLPLLPSRKASPPFGRYQLVLLGEQRHIGVRIRNGHRLCAPRRNVIHTIVPSASGRNGYLTASVVTIVLYVFRDGYLITI